MQGGPIQSPYFNTWPDINYDWTRPDRHCITITIVFANATRLIDHAEVYRAPDCLLTHIVVGLGTDGTPNSSLKDFDMSARTGILTISAQQMSRPPYNCDTIEQFMAEQITAY